jgi:hypothetical protein
VKGEIELRGRVILRGVGFWGSRQHEEIGGAPNHFELIPVPGDPGYLPPGDLTAVPQVPSTRRRSSCSGRRHPLA